MHEVISPSKLAALLVHNWTEASYNILTVSIREHV
jgi:hypothetical protein